MPRGDRKGPMGAGAMMGRGAGFCAGSGIPGYANPPWGRGYGMEIGRGVSAYSRGYMGGGRGWRNRFFATGVAGGRPIGVSGAPYGYRPSFTSPTDPNWEKQSLERQSEALQAELEAVKKRLSDLETAATA